MAGLDADRIRRALDAATCNALAEIEVFPEIESTNSYLMRQSGPEAGRFRVAVTDKQTAGRGRHGKTWQSPPGSGLCLSMAYTFGQSPGNLPALTLAIGLGAIENLGGQGIAGLQLKWPNDLIASNGKLGGILTEAKMGAHDALTVVTGIGLNIDLGDGLVPEDEGGGALRVVDLRSHAIEVPPAEHLAATLINGLQQTFVAYEQNGFEGFSGSWADYDWLHGREVSVEISGREVSGIGAGIASDGALLLETRDAGTKRITSGTVLVKETREYSL